MGGMGSGRPRWKNSGAIENNAVLDIRTMRRRGWLLDGKCVVQNLTWSWRLKRAKIASADIVADLINPADRHIFIQFRLGDRDVFQRIPIVERRTPFNGHRLFFLCPVAHVTCEVLCLGPHGFASPRANRTTYQSQGQTRLGRMVAAKSKLDARLWPEAGPRAAPRGANKERLLDRFWDLEFQIDEIFDKRQVGG